MAWLPRLPRSYWELAGYILLSLFIVWVIWFITHNGKYIYSRIRTFISRYQMRRGSIKQHTTMYGGQDHAQYDPDGDVPDFDDSTPEGSIEDGYAGLPASKST